MSRQATAKRQALFLEAYALDGTIMHAAKRAGINRKTHFRWMKEAEYAQRFLAAQEEAADLLEREARRRALVGVDEPVFYKGVQCGAVRKYSDVLLIFLLKGLRPEKYRERFEHTGEGGGPIQVAKVSFGGRYQKPEVSA
jgi:hypothetical protein